MTSTLSAHRAEARANHRKIQSTRLLFLDIEVWANLFLQILGQEIGGQLPGLGCVVGAVARLVVGILKGVSGVWKNVNVHRLAQRRHLRFELVHVGRRNAFVLPAKDSQDVGVDLLQRGVIGGEMAIIYNGFGSLTARFSE